MKISATQTIRHIIQLISFILFPALFVLTYSAIKNVCVALLQGNFSVTLLASDLVVIAAVVPITILFGRFFCGFICSFGAMSDLLYFIGGLIMKKRPSIGKDVDRVLKYAKFAILILLVVFIWILGMKLDNSLDPWYVFGIYSRIIKTKMFGVILSVGGALLIVIMMLSLFFERFFCRYLCPLGAIFAIISKLRIFKIKKKSSSCVGCGLCDKKCPMGIDISSKDKVASGECIDCFKCIDTCHKDALKTNVKPVVAGVLTAAAITGIYYGGNTYAKAQLTSQLNEKLQIEESESKYKDGTYTGSARGYRGTVEVEVTVKNGLISDINILSYGDDEMYMERARYTIISQILSTQSTDVDTVSGATFTSNGIISAVANALGDEDYENPNDSMPEGGGHHGGHGGPGGGPGKHMQEPM